MTLKQPFETVVAVHGSIPTGELPETTAVPGAERDPDLADALARLPDKQKQAVAYHYLAGLPYIDVAAILGGSTDAARRAAAELNEYFDGQRHGFDTPLDWRLSAGFRSTVLHRLPEIGYGHTASYAAVARLAGHPKAIRAVGTAARAKKTKTTVKAGPAAQ